MPAGVAGRRAVFGTNPATEYHLRSGFLHALWDIDFATAERPRGAGVELELRFR